ncbi:MAG: hypothetical protein U0270_23515 [Labilithrix sp.]
MRKLSLGLPVAGLFTAMALAGCAADAPREDSATGAQDVVGITDLSPLERTLGLELATPQNPGSVEALRSGECYRALIASPTSYTTFEFRRYSNGAAFWAKKGSGYNSGDQRPVLCVDLSRPDGTVSLSGAALDAVLRYDFGKLVGQDSGMQKTHFVFERGVVHLSRYDVSEAERFDSVNKRPHEQPFEHASTISGRLSSLTIKDVTTDVMFDGVHVRDMEMNGDVAHLIYRYAWRKGEDTGRFTLGEDAVGAFSRRATMAGDGPGYAETYSFARGEVLYSQVGEILREGEGKTTETIELRLPSTPPDHAPLADCTRTTSEAEPAPAFGCTGI